MRFKSAVIGVALFVLFSESPILSLTFDAFGASTPHHDTLTDFLLRRNIFKLGLDGKTIEEGVQFKELQNDSELKKIWTFVSTRLNNRDSQACSIAPDQIIITYADPFFTTIGQLNLSDHLESRSSVEPCTTQPKTLEEFVTFSKLEIQRNKSVGKATVVKFEEVQNSDFLLEKTLAGEKVRIYGVTPAAQKHINSEIRKFLEKKNLKLKGIFYFGSRVMPRTEVVKRDPHLNGKIPINDNGVSKSAVRVGGIANISDLEVAIMFSDKRKLSLDDIAEMKSLFKSNFGKTFYLFSLGIKFFQVDSQATIQDQYEIINQSMMSKGKHISPFQFVSMDIQ